MRPIQAPAGRGRLHITRRGRLLVLALLMALVAVLVLHGRSSVAGVDPAAAPVRATVVVSPGDSLWSIAERVAPTADPRRTVARLRDLNNVADGMLRPGEVLVLP